MVFSSPKELVKQLDDYFGLISSEYVFRFQVVFCDIWLETMTMTRLFSFIPLLFDLNAVTVNPTGMTCLTLFSMMRSNEKTFKRVLLLIELFAKSPFQ